MTNERFIGLYLIAASVPVICATCSTQAQVPQGFFTDIRNVGPMGDVATYDYLPRVSADGLSLYFNAHANHPIPGNQGPSSVSDIWVATRKSTNDPFSGPVNLGPEVNSPSWEELGSLSSDGLTLYFASNRDRNWDIYQATRESEDEPFGAVIPLGPDVNTRQVENSPSISVDGRMLVYSNGRDIWMATRDSSEESFGNAKLLEMNTDAYDVYPSLSADGLVLLTSDSFSHSARPGGRGQSDIYVSVRDGIDGPFQEPVNLNDLWRGSDVNGSSSDGTPFISVDWPAAGSKLYWCTYPASNLTDIFQATWIPIGRFLVSEGGSWRLFRGTAEPSPFSDLAWTSVDFDDANWDNSPEPFGFGTVYAGRSATELGDMRNNYAAVYLRQSFELSDSAEIEKLMLRAQFDDHLVAYINGVEVARSFGTIGEAVPFDDPPDLSHGGHVYETFTIDLASLPELMLVDGENVLAVQAFNRSIDDRDFYVGSVELFTFVPEPSSGLLASTALFCMLFWSRRRCP